MTTAGTLVVVLGGDTSSVAVHLGARVVLEYPPALGIRALSDSAPAVLADQGPSCKADGTALRSYSAAQTGTALLTASIGPRCLNARPACLPPEHADVIRIDVVAGPPSATSTVHLVTAQLAFDYPAAWNRAEYDESSSFSTALVFLSTQTLSNPCATTSNAASTTTSCGQPVRSLGAGGVLVTWSANGSPGWTLQSQPGTSTTVGGRPAKVLEQAPGDCSVLGADHGITVAVERSTPGNWYEMRACLRGGTLLTQVWALLASTVLVQT